MPPETPDDEKLSALLEGRLHGAEREALMAHLAASDDDFDVFTDTAEILRETEEEDGAPSPWRRVLGWLTPWKRSGK